MPKIKKARVRPFTGEIFFRRRGFDGDIASLLLLLGIATGPGHGPGDGGGGGDDPGDDDPGDDDPGDDTDRFFIVGTTLARPTVRALVTNAYTGPVLDAVGSFPPITVTAIVVVEGPMRMLLGHPIMVYKIPQIIQVTYPASLANGGIFLDNYPVNRTDFRLVRGIQNEIRFYVRDVDRKPVPVGINETFTIHITDIATNTLLMSRNLTTLDNTMGIYLLTVFPSEMDTWATTPARWSLSYNRSDGSTVLMWTDRAYSPYSTCTITEGPVPGPAPTVILQTNQLTMMSDNNSYSPAFVGASSHGYTGGTHTFVIAMTNVTGNIRIDGSLVAAPLNTPTSTDWFEVDLQTYSAKTGTVVLNETGNFLWMRVVVMATGSVDQIQYKA